MTSLTIGNINNPPLNGVNGSLVNIDNSAVGGIPFSNTIIPKGPHTLPPPSNNIDSARGIYRGGSRKNKISRKYKMRHRTIKRRYRKRRGTRKHRVRRSRQRRMKGGAFQQPMTTPNYPAGHSQYQNNNGSLSNTYSVGSNLSASSSALANPPPYVKVSGDVDNLNHNTLNAYGNIGAGSGFASRGWF